MTYDHLKEVMKDKSEKELFAILESEDSYQPEAIKIAEDELKKRGSTIPSKKEKHTETGSGEQAFTETDSSPILHTTYNGELIEPKDKIPLKPTEPTKTKELKVQEYTEIDGLLIFPSMYIVLCFIGFVIAFISYTWLLIDMLAPSPINIIFSKAFLYYFSTNIVGILFLVVFTGITMWKFFHRKKSAPTYFIILLLIIFLTNLTNHLLISFTDIFSNVIPTDDTAINFKATVKSFIYLVIFGMYFLNSKRVKGTFIK